ncbi:MAG: hypothetical protein J5814_07735 [Bacteroidaceae bacterium]|nr:hypothetical protein [Bacteroidaceae bacterium]
MAKASVGLLFPPSDMEKEARDMKKESRRMKKGKFFIPSPKNFFLFRQTRAIFVAQTKK